MDHATLIIESEQAERSANWRRFVAILCFIQFYSGLVSHGFELYWMLRNRRNDGPFDDFESYQVFSLGCRIGFCILLYGLGRSLWYGTARSWVWVRRLLVMWAFTMAANVLALLEQWRTLGSTVSFVPPGLDGWRIDVKPVAAIVANVDSLPWIGLLIVATMVARPRLQPPSDSGQGQPWVWLAATWCFCWLLGSVLCLHPSSRSWNVRFELRTADAAWAEWFYCTGVLGVGVLLLLQRRYARTVALAIAMTELTVIGLQFYRSGLRQYSAIQGLFAGARGLNPRPSWTLVLGNQPAFLLLFVDTVASAGPWLLIAWYGWRVSMKTLPDDGSPFPRRYCCRCHYNLRGLETTVCPECGTPFILR